MNNLSFWAKNNPRKAQALIISGHIVAAFLSIQLGVLLLNLGIELPNWLFFLFAGLFIVGLCLYPSKNAPATHQTFHAERRYFDALLLITGIFMTVIGTNHITSSALDRAADISENGRINVAPPAASAQFMVYQETQSSPFIEEQKNISSHKMQKSTVKEWFKKRMVNRYHWFSSSSVPSGAKIPLVILLILGILAIEYGLVYLACSLACNNLAILAVVVFFGGLFGLSALTAYILRGIYPDMPKKKRIWTALIMVVAPILLGLLLARL